MRDKLIAPLQASLNEIRKAQYEQEVKTWLVRFGLFLAMGFILIRLMGA